jgi:hypothetical protein
LSTKQILSIIRQYHFSLIDEWIGISLINYKKLNMKKFRRFFSALNPDWALIYFLSLATGLAAFIRLSHVLNADFPYNDGGMFSVMVADLLANDYALPAYTTYNYSTIPYAYSPLPFYAAAFITELTGSQVIDVIRVLPAVISLFTIPAFLLLALAILPLRIQAFFAVLAFALLPRSYKWLIMGGGLTRAAGFLFAIMTIYFAYMLFTSSKKRYIVLTTITASLCLLSHPEATWFAAFSVLLLAIFHLRDRKIILYCLAVALGVILLTSPWWITVVKHHGLVPLTAASSNGWQTFFFWIPLFLFDFAEEPFLGILSVLGLLGLIVTLARKKYFLFFWLISTFALAPRSGATHAMIPLALLIGISIDQLVLPAISKPNVVGQHTDKNQHDSVSGLQRNLSGPIPKVFLIFLLVYSLNAAYAAPALEKGILMDLPAEEREAMSWIASNTPEESTFIVITSLDNPWIDRSSEWFPVLAQRRSVATVQGTEWSPDGEMNATWVQYLLLQQCAFKGRKCLREWQAETGKNFSHVYVRKEPHGEIIRSPACCFALRDDLEKTSAYSLVFENTGAAIFEKR